MTGLFSHQEINPLLCIAHPREMERPVKAFKNLSCDKIYAKNMVQLEAYNRLRNYFLEHEEYTHLVFFSDDGEITEEAWNTLLDDIKKNPDKPVICGVCNVDTKDGIDDLAICVEHEVSPIWEERKYSHPKKGTIHGLQKVKWQGFPMTAIRRDVVEKIPFRNDAEPNGHVFGQSYDVMFSHDCNKAGIPMYANCDNFFWHLKADEGYKTFGVGKRKAQLIFEHGSINNDDYNREVLYERFPDNFKLVASVVVYNEEDHIEDLLYSLQYIQDLDAVYILDGRYCDDGFDGNPSSTDKTKEIVAKSRIGLFRKYFIGAQKWKSQSHKRNWLWDFIKKNEDSDCWILSIDGDEEVVIPPKPRSINLKPILRKIKEDFVVLESGPHGENLSYPLEFFQLRLFKSTEGFHWYTGDVMVTHDKNCDVVMDHGRGLLRQPYAWIKNLMIFNKWMLRKRKKIQKIIDYRKSRVLTGGKCEYRPS